MGVPEGLSVENYLEGWEILADQILWKLRRGETLLIGVLKNVCIHCRRSSNCLSSHYGYPDPAGRRRGLEGMAGKLCCRRIGNYSGHSPIGGKKNVGSVILVGRLDNCPRCGTECLSYLIFCRMSILEKALTAIGIVRS